MVKFIWSQCKKKVDTVIEWCYNYYIETNKEGNQCL